MQGCKPKPNNNALTRPAVGWEWPRITVITPSFNQAEFLEQTICSVLNQDYPNLEYFIIDGGSADGSRNIIEQYAGHLSYWTSETDNGQAHAINKGLERATGELIGYLNSDDYYLPDALRSVGRYHRHHPDVDLLHGRCRIVDRHGNKLEDRFAAIQAYNELLDLWGVWWQKRNFVQPEVFWSRRATEKVGLLREDLQQAMDYEYWARILRAGGKVGSVDLELACFRIHPEQKSARREKAAQELLQVVRAFLWEANSPLSLWNRLQLQCKWSFDSRFRPEANSSRQSRNRFRHLAHMTFFVMRHPRICFSRAFRKRIAASVRSLSDFVQGGS